MKSTDQLNADTLFAFEMALKGHKQFEYPAPSGHWHKISDVCSDYPCRIYHDLPSPEWTRHDGEDWKGDKDAVIEEVMFCNGTISPHKGERVRFWSRNFSNEPQWRIYAYKLAKPAVKKKVVPWTLQTIPSPLPELLHKESGEICTISVVKLEGVMVSARGYYDYEQILNHFTQRASGSVCGTEEV